MGWESTDLALLSEARQECSKGKRKDLLLQNHAPTCPSEGGLRGPWPKKRCASALSVPALSSAHGPFLLGDRRLWAFGGGLQ